MELTEKVAYLKGYIEGLKLDESKDETKLFGKIADILNDIALEVADLEKETESLRDFCEELDEDLGDVEETVYGDDDDDDDDDDCDYYEVKCPECGAELYLDEDDDPSDLKCPECGAHIDVSCNCCDCEKDGE